MTLARRAFPASLALGLILIAVAALHVGGLGKPFFADDYFFLEQVRDRSLPAAIASPDPLGNFFRPVSRQFYFWTLAGIGRESPITFHIANLLIFLASLVVLYLLARRLAGVGAALVATAFVGFHYAADVPLRWASGSQDVLAVFFGASAIYLHCTGRLVPAAIALFLGLLSKESVAGVALIAATADYAPGTWKATVRRSAGLMGATAIWAVWWLLSSPRRAGTGQTLSFEPSSVVAVIAHSIQVSLGMEFRLGGNAFGHWTVGAALVPAVAGAILWLARGHLVHVGEQSANQRLLRIGIIWSLLGSLPLVLVVPIWSAYFHLWALLGISFVVAALSSRFALGSRIAMIAGLALLSAEARQLDEFSTSRGQWTWQSHVNRHYVDRALRTTETFLRELRAARPTMPPRSTTFFANVPPSAGWQAGDGPLIRWAYRDSTLRSYYLTEFTSERADRGPVLFFAVENDSLKDKTNDPLLLPSFAYSMLLAEKPTAALEALDLAIARSGETRDLCYWRAWARMAIGDTVGGRADLERAGLQATRTLPAGAEARVTSAGADTAARIERLNRVCVVAGLNPWVHARLAAILLATPSRRQEGVVEAYAYRVLAADDADAWRKWAAAQLGAEQYGGALASLERYVALSGVKGREDQEVQQVIKSLRRVTQGDLAHRAVR